VHNSAGDRPPEKRHVTQSHVQLVKEGKEPSQEHIDTVRQFELGHDKKTVTSARKSVSFKNRDHPERLSQKRCGKLKRKRHLEEGHYPCIESDDEITSDDDDQDHQMTMYSTEEEDDSDYDSRHGPSSPGWKNMTSVQRATYHARTPRESKIKHEEDATIMMMQGSSDLHDCESTVGIDTDAALSTSCFEADFLWLDKSKRVINSSSINGIGGGAKAKVLGRGSMACGLKKTASGTMAVLIDPNGVLVTTKKGISDFRAFGQQHMKTLGARLVQIYDGSVKAMHGEDALECIYTKEVVPLVTQKKILMLNTTRVNCHIPREVVNDIEMGERSALVYVDAPSIMLMNESKLTDEQLARLYHHRLAHPADDVPVKMGLTTTKLNEDCLCCDKAKFKVQTFKRNDPMMHQKNPPCWRVYADGHGGGLKGTTQESSMGGPSYEGAVGGYVFVDPTSGTLRQKLYATTKQFPAILHQFLTDVESEHFTCKELYVDTHSVNLSSEVEDVAAMFQTKIVPMSAGTPQELACAESGVRALSKLSRSMMLNAPHLPKWCWGLADKNATHVHDVLPQKSKGNKSPFEMRTGKKPNIKDLHIKVFGAPCSCAPMGGAEHKRGQLTERGHFLGMQWPMCLVLTRAKDKVINVSRKKIRVYEGSYIGKPGGGDLPSVDAIKLDDFGNLDE
jgi:hypothetical protein